MKPKYLLCISGKIASGKSHQAKSFVALERGNLERIPLARQLKFDIARLLGVSVKDLDDPAVKAVARPLLQHYGNAMRVLYGENYWVRELMNPARYPGGYGVVVDDVRYPNELRFLELYARYIAHIPFMSMRLYFPDTQDGRSAIQDARYLETYGSELTDEVRFHHSETSLDDYTDWDFMVSADLPANYITALATRRLLRREFPIEFSYEEALRHGATEPAP